MKIFYLVLSIIFCCTVFSCRTVKKMTVEKDIPSITENKLLKNIDVNGLEYNTLFAKRIDVSLKNKKEPTRVLFFITSYGSFGYRSSKSIDNS